MAYRRRAIEPELVRLASERPVVLLTGPRQSGKTTLLRHLFGRTHRYVSLDDPQARDLAEHDPSSFFEAHPPPVIIDEIQYVPGLLTHIKLRVDAGRTRKGQFLLTGSQQLPLMQGVSETLAGRVAVLSLLSMALAEQIVRPAPRDITSNALAKRWIRGGFPELVTSRNVRTEPWFGSYVQTYLERDVRALRQVGDLRQFHSFLLAAAARSGQLLDLSDISRDLGVAVNTVKAWVSVLEASQQIFVLQPYHESLGKRLVKRPKLFFTETGLLAYLLGVAEPKHALRGPAAGMLFETAILGELLRANLNAGKTPRLFFWRTATGDEVDFVIERGRELVPVEAKLTRSPSAGHARGLERFRALYGERSAPGVLVSLSEHPVRLTRGCSAVPYLDFALKPPIA